MIDTLLSLIGIYLFIALGFFGKKHFGDRIDEKSIVILSIYLLQPMLVFWGLTTREIDINAIDAGVLFLSSSILLLIISYLFSKILFEDIKERSVATVSSIIGNTGNLGIPLGIALFGEGSILYTSLINMVNIFIVYTVGVYFYSRGNFSIKESFKNIFKLPAIWFGVLAILYNISGFSIPHNFELPLKMGAYSTMVLQLMIFGIYLATVKAHNIHTKLLGFVLSFKFIIIPISAYILLSLVDVDILVRNVLILELLTPLAVMNVNLASLYDSLPKQVAFLTFATTALFMVYIIPISKWLF